MTALDTVATVNEFSPEALTARLGPDLYALALEAAAQAPAPSPLKVEQVRRILAPAVARTVARGHPALSRAA